MFIKKKISTRFLKMGENNNVYKPLGMYQEITVKNKKGKASHKMFSVVITALVIGALILAGPANAFFVDLNIADHGVTLGQVVILEGSFNLENFDNLIPFVTLGFPL